MSISDPEIKRILVRFLNDLTDMQSNAGCNDFNLAKIIPSVDKRRELMKKVYEINGLTEEYDPDDDFSIVHDQMITYYLIKLIQTDECE